jgi:hypothetical protein
MSKGHFMNPQDIKASVSQLRLLTISR